MKKSLLFAVICLVCGAFSLGEPEPAERIKGLSFVAPPEAFEQNPMPAVKQVHANWIAVIPYGYTRIGQPSVHFNSNFQWWGERPEGVKETLRLAKEAGLKVMLKPQVYIPGSWPGDLDFSLAEWKQWETSYRTYIFEVLDWAKDDEVALFCIGTEFKKSVIKRPEFWKTLIKDIRKVYQGKLTYAANWDHAEQITFWEDLDFVGVDAYFPLVDKKDPSAKVLSEAWKKPIAQMDRLHCQTDRPILFTEWGYLSVEGCAGKTWELEGKIDACNIDEQAQAQAYDAFFKALSEENWWAGGFLWKWFPNMRGHEGYPAKDYTPQGKEAEAILSKWFQRL